jgi:hypothetical protein
MKARKRETFEPATLGNIRSHGCRNLLIYCGSIHCNYQTKMNADHLPDETPIRPLGARMACTRCGHRGAPADYQRRYASRQTPTARGLDSAIAGPCAQATVDSEMARIKFCSLLNLNRVQSCPTIVFIPQAKTATYPCGMCGGSGSDPEGAASRQRQIS